MLVLRYFTFIARDERLGPALQGGRDDGAVSVWKDVLRVVVDIFPAVGAGLRERRAATENKLGHMFIQ